MKLINEEISLDDIFIDATKEILRQEKTQMIFISFLDLDKTHVARFYFSKSTNEDYKRHNPSNSYKGIKFRIFALSIFQNKEKLEKEYFDLVVPISFLRCLRKKGLYTNRDKVLEFIIRSKRVFEIKEISS